MHQSLRVSVGEGLENRLADLEGVLGREHAAPPQCVGERFPFDERHHVIHQAFTVPCEVNREDGRVLQPGEGLRLLAEARDHPRRPRDLGMKHLASQAPVEVHVPQLVHLREPPAAHQPLHLVLRAQRPLQPLRGRLGGDDPGGPGCRHGPLARDDRGGRIAAGRAERGAGGNLSPAGGTGELGRHGSKDSELASGACCCASPWVSRSVT